MDYYRSENRAVCINCPDNCARCAVFSVQDHKAHCVECRKGYYLDRGMDYNSDKWYTWNSLKDNDFQCKACAKGCSECYGPDLAECKTLVEGFGVKDLSPKQTVVTECPPGCAACGNNGADCLKCKQGYLSKLVPVKTGEEASKKSPNLYTCSACKVASCARCLLKNGVETCTACQEGFGFTPSKDKCEPCADKHCADCRQKHSQCQACKPTHYLDLFTGQCVDKPANCERVDEMGKCQNCKKGYSLTSSKTCSSCAIVSDYCLRCGPQPGEDKLRCHQCSEGFFWHETEQKCKLCGPHCVSCRDENTCTSCLKLPNLRLVPGNGKCELSDDFGYNCLDFDINSHHYSCYPHFYSAFTSTGCDQCDSSCYDCTYRSSEMGTACTSCDVTKYSYRYKEGNILKTLCQEQCPEKDKDGNELETDNILRRCVRKPKKTEPEKEPEEEWVPLVNTHFNRSLVDGKVTVGSLLEDSRRFVAQFAEYRSESVALILERGDQSETGLKDKYPRVCTYSGKFKQIFSLNREAYLVCICNAGFFDSTCGTPERLFEDAQRFVVDVVRDLSSINYLDFNSEIAEIYINLVKTSLSQDTLQFLLNSVKHEFTMDTVSCADSDLFIMMLDALLTANFQCAEEIRHTDASKNIEAKDVDKRTYQRMHSLIDQLAALGDRCLGIGSVGDISKSYTSAFQILRKSSLDGALFKDPSDFLTIEAPNLIGTTRTKKSIKVKAKGVKNPENDLKPSALLGVAYSSQLFAYKDYLYSSHLVSLDVLFDSTLHSQEQIKAAQEKLNIEEVTIHFPLRFVQVNEDELVKNLKCLEITYSDKDETFKVEVLDAPTKLGEQQDGETYLQCMLKKGRYSSSWKDTFFTIGFKSDLSIKQDEWIDSRPAIYDFVFKPYPRKFAAFLALASATGLALLSALVA